MKVALGHVSKHAGYLPYFATVRKDMWKANRIEPDVVWLQTTVNATNAVISGSVNMTILTADTAIAAVDKGADLVSVFGVQSNPVYSLIVPASVETFAQLKGKRIGVSAINSGDSFFAQRMLAKGGLQRADYDLLQAGGSSERYAALKSGAIAGALLIAPFDIKIVGEGYRRLAISTDAVPVYAWSDIWVRRDWAKANSDTLVRTLRTMRASHLWVYDSKNKDEAIQMLVDELQSSRAEATETYDLLVTKGKAFAQQGEIPDAAMQVAIDFTASQTPLKKPIEPRQVIDLSYLKQAGATLP